MSQLSRRQFLAAPAAPPRPSPRARRCPRPEARWHGPLRPQADLKVLDRSGRPLHHAQPQLPGLRHALGTDEQAPGQAQMVQTWSVAAEAPVVVHAARPAFAGTTATGRGRGRGRVDQALGRRDSASASCSWPTPPSSSPSTGRPSRSSSPSRSPRARGTRPSLEATLPFIMPAAWPRLPRRAESRRCRARGRSGRQDEWQPGTRSSTCATPTTSPAATSRAARPGPRRSPSRRSSALHPDAATTAAPSRPARSTVGTPPVDSWRGSKATRAHDVQPGPRGIQGWIRPNHLQPPFDTKAARQALLYW